MTIEGIFGQFIGFIQGLVITIIVIIYFKLRERVYRLELALFKREQGEAQEPKRKKKPKEY